MSIDCSYKDVQWCQRGLYKSDDCICDANLIVPDSQSDIAKIISVKAHPVITAAKAESGRIQLTGQVKFNVLYIGEDDSSKICTIVSIVPFSQTLSASVTEDFLLLPSITGCSCDYTLVNSRKCKASALLKLSVEAFKNNTSSILVCAPNAQTKSNENYFCSLKALVSKNIPISENIDLPQGKGAISLILRYSASISDYDYKILNNKAIVKGNISIYVLYLSASDITDTTLSFPFTEVVEAQGLSPNLDTNLTLTVSDCEILKDTDLSGEYRMFDVNLLLNVTIKAFHRENATTITDIYYPKNAVKTQSTVLPLTTMLPSLSEEEFVKETLTLNKTMPQISRVLDLDTTFSELSVQDDNTLSAIAEVTLLYQSSDSFINSHTQKFSVSHRFGADVDKIFDITLKHSGYALSGDNTVEIRLGVGFNAHCSKNESLTVFTLCEEIPYTPENRASIVVCFVREGDSMWDIAKKYNIPVSSLASANALEENSVLTVGEKLLIPR